MKINYNKYFHSKGLDDVYKRMEDYLPELFAQKEFIDNNDKIEGICDNIENLNSSEVIEYFFEYNELKDTQISQLCWLAYHVGYQSGVHRKKIEED